LAVPPHKTAHVWLVGWCEGYSRLSGRSYIARMAQATTGTQPSFDSLNPRNDAVLGSYPIAGAAQVNAAVRDVRQAGLGWAGLGFAGRARVLGAWRKLLVDRLDELAEVVSAETGKPMDDARLELVLTIDHLAWAAKNAKRVLGPRTMRSGMLMLSQKATLSYPPYGVIGVIGPWNYPVFTPMGSIAYALAAGNAVVFKPSEYTPGVGAWLVDSFAEVAPDRAVLRMVTGLGDTGAALCRSGVDKIAFTGSGETGRRVMATCAESLTPVLIECGGKDPLIVDSDADLEAAADAAVWGGMSNAGQTCVGVERAASGVEGFARAHRRAVVAQSVALAALRARPNLTRVGERH
jgi:acyl-CoA reductase-like NAD-dependent aldehyde dehydrogenase